MYKYAAQNKLRFPSIRGELTVEQLFEAPLRHRSGFDLDSIAKTINNELKTMSEESFVETNGSSPRKKELEISLEIVKDVIKTKIDAEKIRENRHKKAEERKKILDIINAKKDEQLSQATLEDLEARLVALED